MTAGLRPSGWIVRACSLVFLLGVPLSAQAAADAQSAQLTGRVLDPDGRPIPNADVFITHTATVPLQLTAEAEGRFTVEALAPGRYELRASAPGFVADPIEIDVAAGANATRDLSARVSAVAETLVVSASQIDQALSGAPDSVTVISGRDIDARQQFTIGSALESVPGLTVQR